MKLSDDYGFSALKWVKPEIDQSLSRARDAVESYADEADDDAAIERCLAELHQVQGSLRMVELYGAAMVVDEMEALAVALRDRRIRQREESLAVLLGGMVQLPDYLERLQSGHKDIPIVLLPLLNDLRACRGEKFLTESVLFAPNLDAPLPDAAGGAPQPLEERLVKAGAAQLRFRYQRGLLDWIRGENPDDALRSMIAVLDELRMRSFDAEARRLWWIAAAVLDTFREGQLEGGAAIKLLFGRVDREVRKLFQFGESGFRADPPRDLSKNLLYYLARCIHHTPRSESVERTYGLSTLLPSESEMEHAKGSLGGKNRALLDTVSAAIKEDLIKVKDAIDLHIRSGASVADLAPQGEILDRVADTLGMLGLGEPRRAVQLQRDVLNRMASVDEPAEERALMDVAGALLRVESSLDENIDRLGADAPAVDTADADDFGGLELPPVEVRKIVDALLGEAQTNLARVRDAVVAFVETPWDHARVEHVPSLLNEVAGALSMLALDDVPPLVIALKRFVEAELLHAKRVPDERQIEHLADAFTAIDYFLEAAREHRGDRAEIIASARDSLAALGWWPVPPATDPADRAQSLGDGGTTSAREQSQRSAIRDWTADFGSTATPRSELGELAGAALEGSDRPPQATQYAAPSRSPNALSLADAASGDGDGGWVEVEEQVPDGGATEALPIGFRTDSGQEVDQEIRQIFLEEVGEETAQLQKRVPAWVADRGNVEILKSIRRSFHTLKGSGRLVGALAIGEFSWKVENLLNRLLDGNVAPTDATASLIAGAVGMLPELQAALAEDRAPRVDIAQVMSVADELAAGRHAELGEHASRTVRRVRRVWVPRTLAADAGPPQPGVLADLVDFHGDAAESLDTAVAADATSASASAEPTESANAGTDDAATDDHAEPATAAWSTATGAEQLSQRAQSRAEQWSNETADLMPALDPLLLEILRSEVGGHLKVLKRFVDEAQAGLIGPVGETLVQAIHTMSGALSMSDVPGVAEVAAPLEGYVKRLRAQRARPDGNGVDAMARASEFLHATVALLDQPGAAAPTVGDLPDTLARLRDALPPVGAVFVDEGEIMPVEADLAFQGLFDEVIGEPAADADTAGADAPGAMTSLAGTSAEDEYDALELALNSIAEMPEADLDELEWLDDVSVTALPYDAPPAQSAAPTEPGDATSSIAAVAASDSPDMATDAVAAEIEDHSPSMAALTASDAQDGTADAGVGDYPADDAVQSFNAPERAAAGAPQSPEPSPTPSVHSNELAAPRGEPDALEDGDALDLGDTDLELIELFVDEGEEQLDACDGAMARLREDPTDNAPIGDLQRELHTLKGNARAVGIAPVGDLTHAVEAVVEAIAGGSLAARGRVIESLERGFDQLHWMVRRVARNLNPGYPSAQIEYFQAMADGADISAAPPSWADDQPAPAARAEVSIAPAPAPPSEPWTPNESTAEDDSADQQPAPKRVRLDKTLFESAAEDAQQRTPQELIRVRSDLLDSLVNFAGEVAIYRSRLEQQMGTYRANLVELDQTVARVRGQLRQLEIETETQILSRFAREAEASGEGVFDPLELDRFSALQQLSRGLSESVADLVALQSNLDDLTRQSETLLLQQSRVNTELQEGLMRTRMVPFDSVVPFLRRLLRQTGDELGKRAQLRIDGAQGEMDRNLLERMKAPLEHMLRNAVAHGVESPAERSALGKPAEGEVRIAVGREATEVILRVSDDGRGMNRDAIRRKAIERGLLREDAQLSDRDLFAFVLEAGFSTVDEVTQIAGRGVGMDVVASEIKQLGGSLAIDSASGQGTTFTVRLPFTLAVTQAVMVRLGEHQFAVPMSAVQGVARIERKEFASRLDSGAAVFAYAGDEFALHDLAHLLNVSVTRRDTEPQLPLLLIRAGDQRAAIRIDSVLGSREVVVKSVGPQVNSVPGIFGATILGDGSVVMILDLPPLLRRAYALREEGAVGRALETALAEAVPGLVSPDEVFAESLPNVPEAPATEPRRRPLVMVVDDSITMRRVTSRVLERNDLEVVTAKDGLDAVERFQERIPDLILLDIEMPRMDGYELATYVRNDVRLRRIPIMMITSRSGEKHRKRALDLGVERYLSKPYQEAELLKQVAELLNLSHELK